MWRISSILIPVFFFFMFGFGMTVSASEESNSLISEVEQFQNEVQSRLEEMEPILIPSSSPEATPAPEDLTEEYKEYMHDSRQLLQYILLFLCVCCGICLCCCVARFINHV